MNEIGRLSVISVLTVGGGRRKHRSKPICSKALRLCDLRIAFWPVWWAISRSKATPIRPILIMSFKNTYREDVHYYRGTSPVLKDISQEQNHSPYMPGSQPQIANFQVSHYDIMTFCSFSFCLTSWPSIKCVPQSAQSESGITIKSIP